VQRRRVWCLWPPPTHTVREGQQNTPRGKWIPWSLSPRSSPALNPPRPLLATVFTQTHAAQRHILSHTHIHAVQTHADAGLSFINDSTSTHHTHTRCNDDEVGTKWRENPHGSTTLIKQTGNPGQAMEHRTQDRNMETTSKQRPTNNNWSTDTQTNKLNKITRGRG